MNWNTLIRQSHRWLSIIFVAIVASLFAILAGKGKPVSWAYYLPLAPLALLTISGLWMFILPYTVGWRQRRRSGR